MGKLTNRQENLYHSPHHCEILEYWRRGKVLKALSGKTNKLKTPPDCNKRIDNQNVIILSIAKWEIVREDDVQARALYPANLTINMREQ